MSLDYKWEVSQDGETLTVETRHTTLDLTRDEALALLESLNAALPQMAVKL